MLSLVAIAEFVERDAEVFSFDMADNNVTTLDDEVWGAAGNALGFIEGNDAFVQGAYELFNG